MSSASGRGVRCDEGAALFDSVIGIDVYGHPTVSSVAALDERPADLVAMVSLDDGTVVETTVTVSLNP